MTTDTGPPPDSPNGTPPGEPAPTGSVPDKTPDSEPDHPDEVTPDEDGGNPSREAAKWRTKFRTAQQQIATLESQLNAMRQAQIEKAVTDAGYSAKTAELIDMDTVLDAAGAIDADQLAAEIRRIADEYGVATTPRAPKPNRQQGSNAGAPRGGASWTGALKGQ
jgi:hypothetical protein